MGRSHTTHFRFVAEAPVLSYPVLAERLSLHGYTQAREGCPFPWSHPPLPTVWLFVKSVHSPGLHHQTSGGKLVCHLRLKWVPLPPTRIGWVMSLPVRAPALPPLPVFLGVTYTISCDRHGVFCCPRGWWQRGHTTHLVPFLLQQRKGGPTRLTLPSKSTVSPFLSLWGWGGVGRGKMGGAGK